MDGVDVSHYAHPDDIVARLGNGHVGGETYLINLPNVSTVDFLFAHSSQWMRSIVAADEYNIESESYKYFSLPLAQEQTAQLVAGVFHFGALLADTNQGNPILKGFELAAFVGESLISLGLTALDGADFLIAIGQNLTKATWAGYLRFFPEEYRASEELVQRAIDITANIATPATDKLFEWAAKTVVGAIQSYTASIDALGNFIKTVAKATADIMLWAVDTAIDLWEQGVNVSTAALDWVIDQGVNLWRLGVEINEEFFTHLDALLGYSSDGAHQLGNISDILVSTDSDPDITGSDANDLLVGNNSDNVVMGGSGSDVVLTGGGADTIQGTAEQHNSDSILDFGNEDAIKVVNSIFDLFGINASAGSIILNVDTNQDMVAEFSVSLDGDFNGRLVTEQPEGSTLIHFSSMLNNGQMIGATARDIIAGSPSDDNIFGEGGNDQIVAREGNDVLAGGHGNDRLFGGPGTDTAQFDGNLRDYLVFADGEGQYIVNDLNSSDGDDGRDILTDVEFSRFGDSTRAIADAVTELAILDDDNFHWDSTIGIPNGDTVSAAEGQLFRTYFGTMQRFPDDAGFDWWLNEIQSGRHDLRSMAAGFIWSEEFLGYVNAPDGNFIPNGAFLTHMYEGVFWREPDGDGYNWWLNELDSGSRSQVDVLVDMTQSNEYVELALVGVVDYLY